MCQGRSICTTEETMLGHGDLLWSRRDGRYRVEWITGHAEKWIGEGDTRYDALEMAVQKWTDAQGK